MVEENPETVFAEMILLAPFLAGEAIAPPTKHKNSFKKSTNFVTKGFQRN